MTDAQIIATLEPLFADADAPTRARILRYAVARWMPDSELDLGVLRIPVDGEGRIDLAETLARGEAATRSIRHGFTAVAGTLLDRFRR